MVVKRIVTFVLPLVLGLVADAAADGLPRSLLLRATVEPAQARPGDVIELSVSVLLPPGWIAYGMEQEANTVRPARIVLERSESFAPVDSFTGPAMQEKVDPAFNLRVVRYYAESPTFRRTIVLDGQSPAGKQRIFGRLDLQVQDLHSGRQYLIQDHAFTTDFEVLPPLPPRDPPQLQPPPKATVKPSTPKVTKKDPAVPPMSPLVATGGPVAPQREGRTAPGEQNVTPGGPATSAAVSPGPVSPPVPLAVAPAHPPASAAPAGKEGPAKEAAKSPPRPDGKVASAQPAKSPAAPKKEVSKKPVRRLSAEEQEAFQFVEYSFIGEDGTKLTSGVPKRRFGVGRFLALGVGVGLLLGHWYVGFGAGQGKRVWLSRGLQLAVAALLGLVSSRSPGLSVQIATIAASAVLGALLFLHPKRWMGAAFQTIAGIAPAWLVLLIANASAEPEASWHVLGGLLVGIGGRRLLQPLVASFAQRSTDDLLGLPFATATRLVGLALLMLSLHLLRLGDLIDGHSDWLSRRHALAAGIGLLMFQALRMTFEEHRQRLTFLDQPFRLLGALALAWWAVHLGMQWYQEPRVQERTYERPVVDLRPFLEGSREPRLANAHSELMKHR